MFKIQEISDGQLAFGAHDDFMMPKYEDIPDEFKGSGTGKFGKFFTDMFFKGIKNCKLYPKEGVDAEKAWRHIRAVTTSWSSAHEHKTAGVIYLLNEWFEDVEWEAAK